jgi:translation initiation factor 2 beta subunit (eIF-2beta)/eIF-5
METANNKIANLKVEISENCTGKEIEIIKLYWKLEEMKFVNTPKQIIEKFELSQSELSKLIASYSTLSFYVPCKTCNSYENHQAKSKTQFVELIKKAGINSRSIFKCCDCILQEHEKLNLEKVIKKQLVIQKFENAIADKNWRNLSKFERGILVNCLEMDYKKLSKHYGNQLGQSQFILLIKALENIENQNLLLLIRDHRTNYIRDFQKLERLSDFREDISITDEYNESSVEVDSETDELKFKLLINKNQHHPDSPLHAGTVTFKERIVIEPGVEYIFGMWQRAKENLYLTMIPIENFEKLPLQKRMSDHPISLQKGIQDFLKNLGKNF